MIDDDVSVRLLLPALAHLSVVSLGATRIAAGFAKGIGPVNAANVSSAIAQIEEHDTVEPGATNPIPDRFGTVLTYEADRNDISVEAAKVKYGDRSGKRIVNRTRTRPCSRCQRRRLERLTPGANQTNPTNTAANTIHGQICPGAPQRPIIIAQTSIAGNQRSW